MKRYLIVTGREEVRDAFAGLLRPRGIEPLFAEDAKAALHLADKQKLHAVIIESKDTDPRTNKLRQQIVKVQPGCRVALATQFDSVLNSTDLFRRGRHEYLVDERQLIELIERSVDGPAEKRDDGRHAGVTALTQVIDVLVGLQELGDHHFGGTTHQAKRLAREIAQQMLDDPVAILEIEIATLLRDIGKVGLTLDVLREKGTYSPDQRDRMKEHVSGSLRLLEHIDFPWKVMPIIRHHHERYDGGGYPDGLKGRQIPVGARIVAVVDAYIAMLSNRDHRSAMQYDEVLCEMERQVGGQFDPEVIEVLKRVVDRPTSPFGAEPKPRIVLYEPNREFRRLLQMRLLNEGMRVQVARTPRTALRKVRVKRNAPNLLLADVDAKPQKAMELLYAVRDDARRGAMPVMFLTAGDDRILRMQALRAGVDGVLSKSDDLEELLARIENTLVRESMRSQQGRERQRPGIVGQIENLPLPDIVQILSMGMKTACVTLRSNGTSGRIWFRSGSPVHASAGEEAGEAAFYEMLRWTEAEFSIEHNVDADETSIDADGMFLVMEGLRRIDEDREAAGGRAS